MIDELITRNRSYRRFYEDKPITRRELESLVELARLSPSAANLQPLKFIVSHKPAKNEKIFSCLAWAGYLKDWPGPEQGERPSGYVIILGDTNITKEFGCNHGIAAQSILLGAVERGLGGCMIASIQRDKLKGLLNIPAYYEILLVIALGEPKERVVIVEAKEGDIKYWRDANKTHHVPKRPLSEILLDL
ncbi:MAG TPA: nitroreductase family protein [Syntrophorhabdaceae bacterium]|nr:nitroreductase family protein [Syntrophorhabdaceae bacterium]